MRRTMMFVGVLLLGMGVTARATSPDFERVPIVGLGSFVFTVATEDFDNDRNLDLVGSSSLPKSVVMFYGDGSGQFPDTYSLAGDFEYDRLGSAYIDDDEYLDVVAGRFMDGEIRVSLNNGDRSFTPLPPIAPGLPSCGR